MTSCSSKVAKLASLAPFSFKNLPYLASSSYIALVLCTTSITTAHADDYTDVNRFLRAGQWAEAVSAADKALVAKPRDVQLRFMKGVALSEQNKPSEAISIFTKITEDYPEITCFRLQFKSIQHLCNF